MKINNLIPPLRIHPILLVFIIISILTGTFVEMFIILAIVLFHELGHYTAAIYFKWRIRQVMLWVFGGVMDTDEQGSRPIREEFIVTIAGPFQHVVIFILMALASSLSLLSNSLIEMILFYNTTILVFNLLPIWPLDGGKLLFFLFTKQFTFQKAYHSILIWSVLLCVLALLAQVLLFPFTLSAFLLMLFLLVENHSEWKKRHYVFIRFLLGRFTGKHRNKAVKPILVPAQYKLMDVFSYFSRDVRHSICIQLPNDKQVVIDESECLRSYFYDKNYDKTIGEIVTYTPI
ncbi:site-2 protease family protein [Ornithinibacillus scapharcae]|uniref:site-2 protease family protein n=1 Tax=Ornithinibacillus scapharcae TaxID=1147159 RepID=UPI000225BE8A|nr:site-2 protease family protein [Ornithinibacillus scapharcae]